MVATFSFAARTAYYLQQTAYYVGGCEAAGQWYAAGGDHGLQDGTEVDNRRFELMFAGVDDKGKCLASNGGARAADRVPAFDYTFSAPKSFTLKWAFGPIEKKRALETAHGRAVRTAMRMLEDEAAYARRGKNGVKIEKVRLSAALFRHGESRPARHDDGKVFADPQLHTHAVIMNIATRADGTKGALHSVVLRDWKMAAGAYYHAALAYELHLLGISIDRIGDNGIFEIAGVDAALIDYFSARRRDEIETELAAHGVTSKDAVALAAAIAKSTRSGKQQQSSHHREETWIDAARDRGLNIDALSGDLPQQQPVISAAACEKLLAERLAALPRQLTETQSVIERRGLVRAVAASFVGTGLPSDRIKTEVDQLIKSGVFLEIGRDKIGLPRYSTPEMILIERGVVDLAERLTLQDRFALDPKVVLGLCKQAGLSDEQSAAAVLCTGAGGVSIIEGAPGSGKSTLLKTSADAFRIDGYNVIGAAAAWRVANALRDDIQIDANATASWLEQARRGKPFLDAKAVLIVDEAGLIGSREMHELLLHVEKVNAKIILVGDRKQLQPIAAGSGLPLVARAIEASRVDTIVRQREPWARDAIVAFGRGNAVEAIEAFADRGHVIEADGAKAAIDSIVQQWRSTREPDAGKSPLVLARTNAQVDAISRALRAQLRAEGLITGPDVVVQTSTPSGRHAEIALAVGDQIRFQARNDALGVVNGTTAKILRVERDLNADSASARSIRLHAELEGRTIEFSPDELADGKGRARLGWGYVSTVFGSQGTTVDKTIVLLDPGFDRHAIYVGASRARIATTFVLDAKAIDKQVAAGLPFDLQSNPAASTPEVRRAWLAGRLSQSHVKETTLDVLPIAVGERANARPNLDTTRQQAPSRRRSRELSLE